MEVFVSFKKDGSIRAIWSTRDRAVADSELPMVQSGTVDLPEVGITTWRLGADPNGVTNK